MMTIWEQQISKIITDFWIYE